MDTIELSPNDKGDLLELLDYALEKKKLDDENKKRKDRRDNWTDSKYWTIRINQLKSIVKGYKTHGYIASSYETIDYDMNERDKEKYRYKKSLESDIYDLLDCKEEWKSDFEKF